MSVASIITNRFQIQWGNQECGFPSFSQGLIQSFGPILSKRLNKRK
jgi:hypothetical protein